MAAGTEIVGLDVLEALGVHLDVLNHTCYQVKETGSCLTSQLVNEFIALFSEGLGCTKGFVHKVVVKPSVAPVQPRLRHLPLAVCDEVTEEL